MKLQSRFLPGLKLHGHKKTFFPALNILRATGFVTRLYGMPPISNTIFFMIYYPFLKYPEMRKAAYSAAVSSSSTAISMAFPKT